MYLLGRPIQPMGSQMMPMLAAEVRFVPRWTPCRNAEVLQLSSPSSPRAAAVWVCSCGAPSLLCLGCPPCNRAWFDFFNINRDPHRVELVELFVKKKKPQCSTTP